MLARRPSPASGLVPGAYNPLARAELFEPVARPYILALPAWSGPEFGHNNTAYNRGGSGQVAL